MAQAVEEHSPTFFSDGDILLLQIHDSSNRDLYMGVHPAHGKVALKRMRLVSDPDSWQGQWQSLVQEVGVWSRLRHPHILPFLGLWFQAEYPYLVSPFLENGTLMRFIQVNPNVDRIELLRDVADGLAYLHNQRLAHGGVQANNVLVSSQPRAMLCGFTLTIPIDRIEEDELENTTSSVRWRSPERLGTGRRSFEDDIYAYGITIHEVLSGKLPFNDLDDITVIKAVMIDDLRPPKLPMGSINARSYDAIWTIAERCWAVSPTNRPSMMEVLSWLTPAPVQSPAEVSPLSRGVAAEFGDTTDMEVEQTRYHNDKSDNSTQQMWQPSHRTVHSKSPSHVEATARPDVGQIDNSTEEDTLVWFSAAAVEFYPLSAAGEDIDHVGEHRQYGKVALKRLGKWGDIWTEVAIWRRLHHVNVLSFLGVLGKGHNIYAVSPWVENGSLPSYLSQNPGVDRARLLNDVAAGLEYLHYNGVVHGDVKGLNILISPDIRAMLSGFGLSKWIYDDSEERDAIGTFRWMSPERLLGSGRSFEDDVYSFGLTIYEALSDQRPFSRYGSFTQIIQAVVVRQERPEQFPSHSLTGQTYNMIWKIASLCWAHAPHDRPAMRDVLVMEGFVDSTIDLEEKQLEHRMEPVQPLASGKEVATIPNTFIPLNPLELPEEPAYEAPPPTASNTGDPSKTSKKRSWGQLNLKEDLNPKVPRIDISESNAVSLKENPTLAKGFEYTLRTPVANLHDVYTSPHLRLAEKCWRLVADRAATLPRFTLSVLYLRDRAETLLRELRRELDSTLSDSLEAVLQQISRFKRFDWYLARLLDIVNEEHNYVTFTPQAVQSRSVNERCLWTIAEHLHSVPFLAEPPSVWHEHLSAFLEFDEVQWLQQIWIAVTPLLVADMNDLRDIGTVVISNEILRNLAWSKRLALISTMESLYLYLSIPLDSNDNLFPELVIRFLRDILQPTTIATDPLTNQPAFSDWTWFTKFCRGEEEQQKMKRWQDTLFEGTQAQIIPFDEALDNLMKRTTFRKPSD